MERVARTSAVSNARWIAVSRVVSIAVQLVGVMWLSRLLSPADYGLVAMALVVTNFAALIRDLGTAQALIQKEDLRQETILTTFWLTLILGALLGIVVAAAAPLVALAFKSPGVSGVLWLLALTFPVLGSTTVQQALLERESRFPLLARIETVAGVSGLGVGVAAAYLGAGAYSLALQSLTAAVVSSVQLWRASAWRPRWFWSQHELHGIGRFSGYMVAFNILIYLTNNVDKMIIGRFLGADSLGMYSLAFRLILFPLQNLTRVAARASYPIMSRQQNSPEEMFTLYLRIVSVIAFITAPTMAGLFVLRDLFVVVVLGTKWVGMGDILFWLAPLGFIKTINNLTGTIVLARGRSDILFYLGILSTTIHVLAFMIGLRWGVAGVAAGYLVAATIDTTYCNWFIFRTLGHDLVRLLRTLLPPVALACAMALIVLGFERVLPSGELPVIGQFVVLVLAGAGSYGLLAFVFARQSLRDLLRLARRT